MLMLLMSGPRTMVYDNVVDVRAKDNGAVKLWDQEMKRCRAFPLRDHGSKCDVVKSVCRIKVHLDTFRSIFLCIMC